MKWVNGDEDSWIPEENFNTMEVINKYFAKGTVNAKKSKKAKNSKKLNLGIVVIFIGVHSTEEKFMRPFSVKIFIVFSMQSSIQNFIMC